MFKDKIKRCKICKILLTIQNSYTVRNLLCKKHFQEYTKKSTKAYHQSERGKRALVEASQRAHIKHREKWLARAKARYAIIKGTVIKPKKCEVCERIKPLQGHHEDYSKPLEVIWLCSRCHADADKKLTLPT